jgi:hypothetical protein
MRRMMNTGALVSSPSNLHVKPGGITSDPGIWPSSKGSTSLDADSELIYPTGTAANANTKITMSGYVPQTKVSLGGGLGLGLFGENSGNNLAQVPQTDQLDSFLADFVNRRKQWARSGMPMPLDAGY